MLLKTIIPLTKFSEEKNKITQKQFVTATEDKHMTANTPAKIT